MNFLFAQSLLEILMVGSVSRKIDTLTSSAGYKQINNKPTYTVNNSSSCIDPIFCNNLNRTSNYGGKGGYYTGQIMKAKNDYTLRMTNKLNDPKAAPKTY